MRRLGTDGKSRSECLCQQVRSGLVALVGTALINSNCHLFAAMQGYYLAVGSVAGDACVPCPPNAKCDGQMMPPYPSQVCPCTFGALYYVRWHSHIQTPARRNNHTNAFALMTRALLIHPACFALTPNCVDSKCSSIFPSITTTPTG